jgi:tripeptidyl-peptidase-1
MCGTYQPTNVISISYGVAEVDEPANYQLRQCNEFMKLGLQGHTILVASGDYGVAANPGDGGEIGCLGDDQKVFSPENPA